MKIEIKRSGMSLGFFTEEEVERGLEIGKFIRSDKWRYEDSEEWRLLSDFLQAKMAGVRPGETIVPWEDESQDLVPRFFATVRGVLLDPGVTFRGVKPGCGFSKPFCFGAAGTILGLLINYAYQLLLNSGNMGFPPGQMEQLSRMAASGVFAGAAAVFIVVFVPLALFLGAGVDHLMLLLLGGAKKGYETTFSVFSYASGATSLLNLVPICGSFAAFIWHIVARIIGYSKAHEISGVRATIAVLLPGVFCCVCAVLIAAGIASLAGHEALKQSVSQSIMM